MSARKNPQQRLKLILLISCVMALAVALSAYGLRDYATYFRTPTELRDKPPGTETMIRIGGMVVADSVTQDGDLYRFSISDNVTILPVTYKGILPELFRAKQGIVIEGFQRAAGQPFEAVRVLAKHDEYYMPAEVKRAMDQQASP